MVSSGLRLVTLTPRTLCVCLICVCVCAGAVLCVRCAEAGSAGEAGCGRGGVCAQGGCSQRLQEVQQPLPGR